MAEAARQIADLIDRLQVAYTASSTALIFLNDPDVARLLTAKGYDPGTTIRLGRKDGSYYDGIRLWESIEQVRNNAPFNRDYLGGHFSTSLSWVGDHLKRAGYFDKSPELEFFRHLRNGVSHGNRFHFDNGEPRRPARFRTFEVTAELEGQSVLFAYIMPGDLFDLFDAIMLVPGL